MTPIVLREESLIEAVNQAARQEGLDTAELVARAVRYYLAAYRQQRILIETDAWQRLDAQERARFEGRYVAVCHGQVVDSDPDQGELYRRIHDRYGNKSVLITPGGSQPATRYRIRSARR